MQTKRMIKLTRPKMLVILPTLNEEQGIGPTISEIKDVLGNFEQYGLAEIFFF